MSGTNDHGWTPVGAVSGIQGAGSDNVLGRMFTKATVEIGDRPIDRRTCGCTAGCGPCTRAATQEDFLCDQCRRMCNRRWGDE